MKRELSLKQQIWKLSKTGLVSTAIGAVTSYSLYGHDHQGWALIVAIVTLEIACGSMIIVGDIKRDLRTVCETREETGE
jgi:hypothetical protein